MLADFLLLFFSFVFFFFFFQAEDGIRDADVTGVQTCALPIWPLVPDGSGGPMNVLGIGSVNVDGIYRNLPIIATEGVDVDDEFAAVRSSDVILFESNMLRFRYEQPQGPQTIKLGIWAYTAVLVRYGSAPVKRVAVTEESPS